GLAAAADGLEPAGRCGSWAAGLTPGPGKGGRARTAPCAWCPCVRWTRVGRPGCYRSPKTVRCQCLRTTAVLSNMTCLIWVYSSKEYADMSLPKPDAL